MSGRGVTSGPRILTSPETAAHPNRLRGLLPSWRRPSSASGARKAPPPSRPCAETGSGISSLGVRPPPGREEDRTLSALASNPCSCPALSPPKKSRKTMSNMESILSHPKSCCWGSGKGVGKGREGLGPWEELGGGDVLSLVEEWSGH